MTFFDTLTSPITALADPSRRLFWGFILSSIILVLLSWIHQKKRISFRRIKLTFFSKKYWFSRSTAVDVSFLSLNTALKILLIIPLFGSHLLGAMWVARQLQTRFDTPPEMGLPWLAIAIMYTLIFFIVEDFSRFYLHKTMHKSAFLWRFHKVHHSATTLTPLTLHRVHPVEMTLYYARGMLVFSLVSGIFIYFSGKKLTAIDILGVDALGFLFNFFGANLRHSHVWIGFGIFEKWFISPAQHQIHHSKSLAHRDKNFGSALAVWDKFFGTWVASGKARKLHFGVEDSSQNIISKLINWRKKSDA